MSGNRGLSDECTNLCRVREQNGRKRRRVVFTIVDKQGKELIGNIKLGPMDWNNQRAEIGILFGERDFWGQGIATEAIRLIAEHAFRRLNLHKLTAGCHNKKRWVKKPFKKVGFTQEGGRMEHAHSDGGYTDVIELGLLQAAFES